VKNGDIEATAGIGATGFLASDLLWGRSGSMFSTQFGFWLFEVHVFDDTEPMERCNLLG